MDKLTLAHDWVMKFGEPTYINESVEQAWNYADAMFEEAEKRKDKTLPDAIWQPDWDALPSHANYFAMDECGECYAYKSKPKICDDQWDYGDSIGRCDSFGYTGDWRNSLRIRPSSK